MTGPSPPASQELLSSASVVPYLRHRRLLGREPARAAVLAGGVSNTVLLVETSQRRLVVKQALPQLRVTDVWLADPARAQAEAAALQLLATITPGHVPQLIDSDPSCHALTITAAPDHWTTWKAQLLAGHCDPAVARRLGSILAAWHDRTSARPLPAELEGIAAFEQLRLHPYFDVSAARRPDLADQLHRYADALRRCRHCLVSGDFSPKNVLAGPDGCWVIDLEVAHRGDPAFDVAFLLCHLLLKGRHLPAHRAALRACADAFLAAYGNSAGRGDPRHLHGITGCLLLARVIGSSPVEYLTREEQASIQDAAARILRQPPASFPALWDTVMGS